MSDDCMCDAGAEKCCTSCEKDSDCGKQDQEQSGTPMTLNYRGPALIVDLDYLKSKSPPRHAVITHSEEIAGLIYDWELHLRDALKYGAVIRYLTPEQQQLPDDDEAKKEAMEEVLRVLDTVQDVWRELKSDNDVHGVGYWEG